MRLLALGLAQAALFPPAWQDYLTKTECRDAAPLPLHVPGPRFDQSEVQHLDDPKDTAFQKYLASVNVQTRKDLSKKLAQVARLSNRLHEGQTPRFATRVGERVLFVRSSFSRGRHELVEVRGDRTKSLGLLSRFDATNATLDYAAFSPSGDAIAVAFRPPGKTSGQFVLLHMGRSGLSRIGAGEWDRHPEIAVLKDGGGVVSNQYADAGELSDIVLRRTRFSRRTRFVSTLFSDPGYHRLSPQIVGKRLCVQAFPFRGMVSSLHCGFLAPGNRCIESDAFPRRIAGDDSHGTVLFAGTGEGEQVFFVSDHELDVGAVYLSARHSASHSARHAARRVLGPWDQPIIAAHVVGPEEYIVARGNHQGVVVEIRMQGLHEELEFEHATVTKVSIGQAGALFTLSSLFTPARIYAWDGRLRQLAQAETLLRQEDFEVVYGEADGVPYTHVRNRTAQPLPQCKSRIHTGPGLGGSALPNYSPSHALTLALLPCNELILAHPRGQHGLGRQWRTQAFGDNYFRHLNDLRRVLQTVKTPSPKFVSGHTISNLLLARTRCERALAVRGQEFEFPYYSSPVSEENYHLIPTYVTQQLEWEEPPPDFRIRRAARPPSRHSLQADTSLDRFDGEYFGPSLDALRLLTDLPQKCAESAFLHASFHVESTGLQASLPLKIHYLATKDHPAAKTYFSSKTKFTNESPIFLHAQMLQ